MGLWRTLDLVRRCQGTLGEIMGYYLSKSTLDLCEQRHAPFIRVFAAPVRGRRAV